MPTTMKMRPLRLTSPHMHGEDVERFQIALEKRLKARRRPTIKVDGEYGPATARAYRKVGYLLGLDRSTLERGATVGAQRVIINPNSRTKAQLSRAEARKKYLARRKRGVEGAIREARSHIGLTEHPANSNTGPVIRDWQRECQMGPGPWCGCGVRAWAKAAGTVLTPETRYVPSIEAHAKRGTGGYESWTSDPKKARRGDFACFDWARDGTPDHVGIVVSIDVRAGTVTCIEANTSRTSTGSQDNGGGVFQRTRSLSLVKGYARPDWA